VNKKALITGITGQDGSYLAELLLSKGYEVHGLVRRVSRCSEYLSPCEIHGGDVLDMGSVYSIIEQVRPDECYHLAAISHVGYSFNDEFTTMNCNGGGTQYILAALRRFAPKCRFYFAGSSEMFGKVEHSPQNEKTRFHPRSPYGISKTMGYYLTQNYREAYGMFACSGVLFNHESPRRADTFVSQKIVKAAVEIAQGKKEILKLGNLDAQRDWGYAKEYVEGMWMMLQQSEPSDYVLATGQMHSVREFCEMAFREVHIEIEWSDNTGINKKTGKVLIQTDPTFYRPAEVEKLCGDATKAQQQLGWRAKTNLQKLCQIMINKVI